MNNETNWWQSENGKDNVFVQLDLEGRFRFTHMIMKFKSFRPAAMVIKRSADNGKTWKPYRYFAEDCEEIIQNHPEVSPGPFPAEIDEVICDASYSRMVPFQRGILIYKVVEPRLHDQITDPYSDKVSEPAFNADLVRFSLISSVKFRVVISQSETRLMLNLCSIG